MRPAAFVLDRPRSLAEAIGLLECSEGADDRVRPLAGGQSLIAQLTRRELSVERLVDLGGIEELRGVRIEADGILRLGAMVTLAALEDDQRVAAGWPLLVEAVRHVGHRPIRNRSTVGGCIAFGDPPAEVPLALGVLGAGIGRRGPLITEIAVPPMLPGTRHGFCEAAPRVNDRATAVAAVTALPGGLPRVGLATSDGGPVFGGCELLEAGGSAIATLRDGYPARAARVCARRAVAQALARSEVGR